jgi:hypothetical protein
MTDKNSKWSASYERRQQAASEMMNDADNTDMEDFNRNDRFTQAVEEAFGSLGKWDSEEKLTGLIAAVFDGRISKFKYRNLVVFSPDRGATFFVANDEGTCLGETKCIGTPLSEVEEWVEAKAELYGDSR